jgi:glycosyltransferase involved in cell wall biosynthesis
MPDQEERMNLPPGRQVVVSMVIPAFRAGRGLERTLLSVAAQRPPAAGLQILVANDGADEEVTAVCRRHRVVMVSIQPRRGSYFARNRALERAAGERIVFLDAGIELQQGWLAAALSRSEQTDYLAGEVDISPVSRPRASEEFDRLHAYRIDSYMRDWHFGGAGNLVVRKDVLDALGGFDERLYSGGDVEFGDRVHRAGYRQLYMPEPLLLHPPRRGWSFFRKLFRVKIGHEWLSRLYPERFAALHPSLRLAAFVRGLLPPRPETVRSEFAPEAPVAAWRRFFFLWALKACRTAADLVAVLAPAPRARRPAARIEWHDFSAGRP